MNAVAYKNISNSVVSNALASNGGNDIGKNLKNAVTATVLSRIQEIGSASNRVIQDASEAKALAKRHGSQGDHDRIVIYERKVVGMLDALSQKARRILGENYG